MVKHDINNIYRHPNKFEIISRWAMPLVVLAGSLALYIKTMAPIAFWGGLKDFIAGYYSFSHDSEMSSPLYSFLAELIRYLPGLSTAFKINLLSAILTALSVMLFYLLIKSLLDVSVIKSNYKALPHYQQLEEKFPELKEASYTINLEKIGRPILTELPALAAAALFALTLPIWITGAKANIFSLQLLLIMASLYFVVSSIKNYRPKIYFLGIWFYAISYMNFVSLAIILAPAYLYIIGVSIYTRDNKLKMSVGTVIILATALAGYLYQPIHAIIESAVNSGSKTLFVTETSLLPLNIIPGGELSISALWERLKDHTAYFAGELEWPMICLLLSGLFGIHKISKRLFWFLVLAVSGLLYISITLPVLFEFCTSFPAAMLIGLIILISIAGTYYIFRLKILSPRASTLTAAFLGIQG